LLRFFLFLIFLYSYLLGEQNVKIGVLAHRGIPITYAKYNATAQYLTQEIQGYNFEIVPLGFERLKRAVKAKEVDFVLTNTMYYVELEYLYGLSRIATLKNLSSTGEELTSFGGVILTLKGSAINSLEDLKEKHFGAVDANSFGGWVMAQKELSDAGIEVEDFQSFSFFGSHDRVVIALRNKEIDAGTVRSDTLERMEREGLIAPDLFKVVAAKEYSGFPFAVSTHLYPEWPFARLASTSKELSDRVLIALLQMPKDSLAAKNANISGWTIALDYSSVHKILEELHIGPYKHFGELTLKRFYEQHTFLINMLLTIFGVILFSLLYISKLNHRLEESQEEIEHLNQNLEKKVQKRTQELEELYLHEKYLKDILKTTAEINELLISSFSIKSVVHNSLQKLLENNYYKMATIGMKQENLFSMISKEFYPLVVQDYAYEVLQDQKEFYATKIEKLDTDSLNIVSESFPCLGCWKIELAIKSSDSAPIYGVLSVYSNNPEGFDSQEVSILENIATDIGLTFNSIYQKHQLEYMESEKIANYEETILAFVNIIEQRDSYTAGHTLRVAKYCRILAEALGLEEAQIHKLEKAAILHDIGKVVTPDSILLKPGNLSDLEYELIKEHSEAGYRMLSKIKMYQDLADIIRYHHARYDGEGYPSTSSEDPDTIPFLSHVMAVADAFDAMTTTRIYKPRKTLSEAIEEITSLSAKQFHPKVVSVAVDVLSTIDLVDTTQMPQNELEKRRFSYFFMDPLTDVYNENYLQIMLLEAQKKFASLHRIEIGGFSNFNKEYGWKAGDKFLASFAELLKKRYRDAMVFRYHGDNFILLFEEYQALKREEIESLEALEKNGLMISLSSFELANGVPEF